MNLLFDVHPIFLGDKAVIHHDDVIAFFPENGRKRRIIFADSIDIGPAVDIDDEAVFPLLFRSLHEVEFVVLVPVVDVGDVIEMILVRKEAERGNPFPIVFVHETDDQIHRKRADLHFSFPPIILSFRMSLATPSS